MVLQLKEEVVFSKAVLILPCNLLRLVIKASDDRALQQASARHRIVLPCVTGPSTMELREYTGAADLSIGAFGIPEPTGCLFTHLSDIELALIPGMAFDAAGHRLGRGKGYYDRFLAQTQMQSVRKWGVCYDFQLLDSIPTDAHDQPVERVLIC